MDKSNMIELNYKKLSNVELEQFKESRNKPNYERVKLICQY